jgi:hypothetical protein
MYSGSEYFTFEPTCHPPYITGLEKLIELAPNEFKRSPVTL